MISIDFDLRSLYNFEIRIQSINICAVCYRNKPKHISSPCVAGGDEILLNAWWVVLLLEISYKARLKVLLKLPKTLLENVILFQKHLKCYVKETLVM